MKQMILTAALAGSLAIAAPAMAQDETEGDLGEGFSLLGEGTRLILEGLLEEMRPILDEARPYFEDEVLPFLNRMGELMDELGNYELPERLPNGDILIRRSPDAPPFEPEPGEDGEVEL
jgi:hypothetical protein